MTTARLAPRTALFLPASNPRAIAKARGLSVDLVILDLEDAVRDDAKAQARAAAVEAVAEGFGPGCARSGSTAANRGSTRRTWMR